MRAPLLIVTLLIISFGLYKYNGVLAIDVQSAETKKQIIGQRLFDQTQQTQAFTKYLVAAEKSRPSELNQLIAVTAASLMRNSKSNQIAIATIKPDTLVSNEKAPFSSLRNPLPQTDLGFARLMVRGDYKNIEGLLQFWKEALPDGSALLGIKINGARFDAVVLVVGK